MRVDWGPPRVSFLMNVRSMMKRLMSNFGVRKAKIEGVLATSKRMVEHRAIPGGALGM
jgi:hypothetical protein